MQSSPCKHYGIVNVAKALFYGTVDITLSRTEGTNHNIKKSAGNPEVPAQRLSYLKYLS